MLIVVGYILGWEAFFSWGVEIRYPNTTTNNIQLFLTMVHIKFPTNSREKPELKHFGHLN